MAAWIGSTMRAELVRSSAAALAGLLRELPTARSCGDGFSTEAFIAAVTPGSLDDVTAATLEILARKVEVGRRLRRCYSADLARPVSDEPVQPAFCVALAAAFVHFGLLRQDWKWINTALKMDYGILEEPAYAAPAEIARLLDAALEERG